MAASHSSARQFKRVLITGIAGSGGSYLAEYLARHQPKVEIHGLCRWHSTTQLSNLSAIRDRVQLHECDLLDFSSIVNALRKSQPDAVFHLASHANVRASFEVPLSVMQNNVMSTANLLEATRSEGIKPWFQLCSTSEVYGQVAPNEVPITEQNPLRPASPYAVSKVTQDLLGQTYFLSYGLPVIRTRMFAYINPRRADLFATSFARQVVEIERGERKELLHGNLDSVRTLIDVRDAMEAYWLALAHGEPGEIYNIGGQTSISVGDFLELLRKKSRVKFEARQDPSLLRPSDVTLQIPSTRKFETITNWKPRYTFEESVDLLLEYFRSETL
jgi:GDP-4-dehydro-6-deoxy-D-mannose reductase